MLRTRQLPNLPDRRDLPPESEIIRGWQNPEDIVITIRCMTYNHAPYIEDAIKGFLIQRTTVPFEILIHDDASTDATADIIRSYEADYPGLIKAIYQQENQYSKGARPGRLVINLAKGRYHAICEGDDYWISPHKLQKQYEVLEANADWSMVFTACIIDKQGGRIMIVSYPAAEAVDANQYLQTKYFMATASLFFRREVYNAPHESWMNNSFAGDFVLRSRALTIGRIGYLNDVTCVYRKNTSGSWSTRRITPALARKEWRDNVRGLAYLRSRFDISEAAVSATKAGYRNGYILKRSLIMPPVQGLVYLLRRTRCRNVFLVLMYMKQRLLPRL